MVVVGLGLRVHARHLDVHVERADVVAERDEVVAGVALGLLELGRVPRPAPPAAHYQRCAAGAQQAEQDQAAGLYVGVAGAIAGQAVLFASVGVAVWLIAFVVAVTTFVMAYEEPTLRRTYGPEYDAYARAVHRWVPRLRPWRP